MAEKHDGEGRIQIVVDGEVYESWDASNLPPADRRKIGDRLVHYGNSQTLGLKREIEQH